MMLPEAIADSEWWFQSVWCHTDDTQMQLLVK
jgi:hypothetical protein